MRKRTFVTLLLLAVLSLGFAAGPHPCNAEQGERESPASSCHQAPASSEGPTVRDGGQSCCETACRHACHMPAAVGVRPAAFVVEFVSQVVGKGSGRVLPALAHSIDHVPLA